jgi:hypothetical protein
MKLIWYLAFFLLLTSCSLFQNPTTIEIINNNEKLQDSYQQLNGSLWEVVVFCFHGDDVVDEIHLEPIRAEGGTSGTVEVDQDIEKVKVSFKFLPDDSEIADLIDNDRLYVVTVTYLEKHEHNVITVDGETFLSRSLTKSTELKLQDLFDAQDYNK